MKPIGTSEQMSTLSSKSHQAIGVLSAQQGSAQTVFERHWQGTVPVSAVCIFYSARLVQTMCLHLQRHSTSLPVGTGNTTSML